MGADINKPKGVFVDFLINDSNVSGDGKSPEVFFCAFKLMIF